MKMSDQAQREGTNTVDLAEMLRPSGRLLEAETALGRAIQDLAVARSEHDPTTLDLLVRLRLAPDRQLRGVDLCRQILKSPSHVSRMIDRAESAGLVYRLPDPDDRRAQRITLTDAGEEAVETFVPHLVEVLNQTIYSALDNDEIETLIALLARVADSAHQLVDRQTHTGASNTAS
jgi:DNA-binding MarR family transcriptional regulator